MITDNQKSYLQILIDRDLEIHSKRMFSRSRTVLTDINHKYLSNLDIDNLTKDRASELIDLIKKGTVVNWLMKGGDEEWERPGWMDGAKESRIHHLLRVHVSRFEERLDELIEKGRWFKED